MIEKIVVCGLGKLGTPIATVFANAGIQVTGFDLDASKVEAINAGRPPIQETDLEEAFSAALISGMFKKATIYAAEAVQDADACIFITPTPSADDGTFDNRYLIQALKTIAVEVEKVSLRKHPFVYIITSTVVPGSCDNVFTRLLQTITSRKFYLCYKPELIALGTVIRDLRDPDFHLIGESCEEAGNLTVALYRRVTPTAPNAYFKRLSLLEAEVAKIALNSYVCMKISFANQLGMVAEKLGANPNKILDAISWDRRIGHEAFKYGLPFGGPCFPRDSRMFARMAGNRGMPAPLATATDRINEILIEKIAKQVIMAGGRATIGILGMAYKPHTNVTEESPGIRLVRTLITQTQQQIRTYDPQAQCSHSFEETLDSDVIVVTTAWDEFKTLELRSGQLLIDPMGIVKNRVSKPIAAAHNS